MDDLFEAPLQMVQAFERTTGLNVCFHDLSGQLYAFLPPERFVHTTPLCAAMKSKWERQCVACDVAFTRKHLLEQPHGVVKICHAGLVEWTLPNIAGDRIEWVLFAGQRMPGKGLTLCIKDPAPPSRPLPWPKTEPLPPPVDDEEALQLLEMTRMLAARLREWRREAEASAAVPTKTGRPSDRPAASASRRHAVMRFIQNRHRFPVRLEDLAEHLHISESRAGHAIKEACGASFMDLLLEARLKTAAGLLQHSNLNVLEVAARSGFGDVSNFHATFKKKNGVTPHQFRKIRQAGSVV